MRGIFNQNSSKIGFNLIQSPRLVLVDSAGFNQTIELENYNVSPEGKLLIYLFYSILIFIFKVNGHTLFYLCIKGKKVSGGSTDAFDLMRTLLVFGPDPLYG